MCSHANYHNCIVKGPQIFHWYISPNIDVSNESAPFGLGKVCEVVDDIL